MSETYPSRPKAVSKCIIVAGCPRSGTSMTMQLLAEAGLFVGNELVPSSISNRRGHFEDRRIVALNERILNECGSSWQFTGDRKLIVTDVHRQCMGQIVEEYAAHGSSWGFKDPRVSLFLNEWNSVIGSTCVLMVYRHYTHVSRSLYRRHSRALCYWKSPTDHQHLSFFCDPTLPLHIWLAYNKALLNYYYFHENQCLVVSQDAVLRGWDIISAVNSAFSLGLDLRGARSVESALADNTTVEFDLSWIEEGLRAQLDATWNELSRISRAPTVAPGRGTSMSPLADLQEQLNQKLGELSNIELPIASNRVARSIKREELAEANQGRGSEDTCDAESCQHESIKASNTTANCMSRSSITNVHVTNEQRTEVEFCHWTALSCLNEVPLIRLGIALMRQRRVHDTTQLRDLTLNYSSADPWYHYYAYRWFWQSGAVDAALTECRKALEINPGFWQARLALFYSYSELGLDEDISTLEQAIVYGSAANILLRLSQINASLKRHDREEYYYYAGATIQCRQVDGLDYYERLLQQVNNDVGKHLLLHYLVEHVRSLAVWWHTRLAIV